LDGPDAGKEVGGLRAEDDEDDEDFFDEAAGLPRVLTMAAALDHHDSDKSFNGDNSENTFDDVSHNGWAGKVA